jgi:hypothetical protein
MTAGDPTRRAIIAGLNRQAYWIEPTHRYNRYNEIMSSKDLTSDMNSIFEAFTKFYDSMDMKNIMDPAKSNTYGILFNKLASMIKQSNLSQEEVNTFWGYMAEALEKDMKALWDHADEYLERGDWESEPGIVNIKMEAWGKFVRSYTRPRPPKVS